MSSPFIAPGATPGRITRRRVAVVLFIIFATAPAALLMADLLWGMPLRGWNGVVLTLFTALFALLAFGAGQAFFGFICRRSGGDPLTMAPSLGPDPESIPLAPTAVVMPIYNENPGRVFAGLRAMFRAVRRTGQLEHFDFFVLSDTTDPDTWIEEEAAWADLLGETGAHGRVFYRKRRVNSNKKAGNIADFCRRWGKRYRYMIVLDADSVMNGSLMVKLVRLMEQNPGVGLIQTTPTIVRAETFFARALQFAVRLYGPLFSSGMNYWQQGDSNYWGHNAIIRLAPFMEHCALPELPGREPLGGKILSHDFVEVALLRKAGWAAWMLPDTGGSVEETPPTLIEYAKRDRRWCQGNLQHLWLLLARGLHPSSRTHLLLGILAYTTASVWLVFLLLGTLLMIGFTRTGLTWIPDPGFAASLGVSAQFQFGALLIYTLSLMFGIKALAVFDRLLQPGGAAPFGGTWRMCSSVLVETLHSVLLAPVLMLFHVKFVATTIIGRSVGWAAQQRGAEGTSWREAVQTHGGHTVLGLVWLVVLWFGARDLLLWMLPVLAGMILSIPFSVFTSRPAWGRRARQAGLFCTPEELDPGLESQELESAVREAVTPPDRAPVTGVVRAVLDPYVNGVHRCLLRPRSRQAEGLRLHFAAKREQLLRDGPDALQPGELTALLSDAESVDWLHREVWTRGREQLARPWRQALRHFAPTPFPEAFPPARFAA